MSANSDNTAVTGVTNQATELYDVIETGLEPIPEVKIEQPASSLPDDDDKGIDEDLAALGQIRTRTRSRPGYETIDWKVDDVENPKNWPNAKKITVVALTGMLVLNSTIASAIPSLSIPYIADTFGIKSETQLVLPISVFLIGYVFGPLIWGPLSEHIGRRYLTLATFSAFTLFIMGCGFAPSWGALLVLRFFCGVFASSPIAIVAGILADLYNNPRQRGRAFGVFMMVAIIGPVAAPVISGYTSSTIGWRWSFWVNLIFSAVTLVFTLFMPETYEPILLEHRARKLRAQDPVANKVVAPRELEETDFGQLVRVVLARPLRMLVTEPIVACCCVYLGLVYAVLYMSFEAFPIIFGDLYGLSPGQVGLTYLSIGIGSIVIAFPIIYKWDSVLARAQARNAPWIRREEYRRLPLACVGGPLFVVSVFWLGWTARPNTVHFAVPLLAGLPFGAGILLIFFAILNYLVDAYEIFAASANAASSTTRSVFAVVLPFATSRLFADLGVAGACSLLGGLLAIMCVIPFIFIWKGEAIRAHSKFCVALRERRRRLERCQEERRRREEGVEVSRQEIKAEES